MKLECGKPWNISKSPWTVWVWSINKMQTSLQSYIKFINCQPKFIIHETVGNYNLFVALQSANKKWWFIQKSEHMFGMENFMKIIMTNLFIQNILSESWFLLLKGGETTCRPIFILCHLNYVTSESGLLTTFKLSNSSCGSFICLVAVTKSSQYC